MKVESVYSKDEDEISVREFLEREFGMQCVVRQHTVVGANRILFSVHPPTRLCRIGTYRRFRAE